MITQVLAACQVVMFPSTESWWQENKLLLRLRKSLRTTGDCRQENMQWLRSLSTDSRILTSGAEPVAPYGSCHQKCCDSCRCHDLSLLSLILTHRFLLLVHWQYSNTVIQTGPVENQVCKVLQKHYCQTPEISKPLDSGREKTQMICDLRHHCQTLRSLLTLDPLENRLNNILLCETFKVCHSLLSFKFRWSFSFIDNMTLWYEKTATTETVT